MFSLSDVQLQSYWHLIMPKNLWSSRWQSIAQKCYHFIGQYFVEEHYLSLAMFLWNARAHASNTSCGQLSAASTYVVGWQSWLLFVWCTVSRYSIVHMYVPSKRNGSHRHKNDSFFVFVFASTSSICSLTQKARILDEKILSSLVGHQSNDHRR